MESDLINSYSWDTAIVFIQKYSGSTNYANKGSVNKSLLNTGKSGDKVCNIYDMASNCFEWSTEHSTNSNNLCVFRGGYHNDSAPSSLRRYNALPNYSPHHSFRPLFYLK